MWKTWRAKNSIPRLLLLAQFAIAGLLLIVNNLIIRFLPEIVEAIFSLVIVGELVVLFVVGKCLQVLGMLRGG